MSADDRAGELVVERRDAVAIVTLARVAKANALDFRLLEELDRVLDAVDRDVGIEVMVLDSASPKLAGIRSTIEQAQLGRRKVL